ncbi:alpha-ketoacid dehydrogenase subunit beta [Carboxydochorda subterranea]|uniref:Alpha-ketoacid dehydrogenase subunit beta n=1 Tax=Carboxydichorda subterranea TaxID=3109565 RepID=A0ABZ1BX32_9FIRM|nr:alpha-ketoacid dehydrogenase subunit beta [Limnochorda sp. L945t]WRP17086.1 alpha-ketoacid dehydrogenase subunit beta [Limnochorda sp. L945t]
MAVKRMIDAIREALDEELARDESVIVMGEDVGVKGGVFVATKGLIDRYGPERVIDTPLAESGIVGVAIGAAMNGLRPVAEIQFADFIYPAMDQIISEAARIRYRSNGEWQCPLVVRAPYGAGVRGGLYHSQSVESFFAHVPGLKVVIPSNPADAKGLLKAAIRDDDPVVFLEPKRGYRAIQGEVPEGDYVVPIGPARIAREGEHLTAIAYGMMLHLTMQAAERLEREGVSVEVVDLRTLAPLDRATIVESVKKTGRALVVYEDNRTLGMGAEVAAILAEEALFHLDAPVRRVAMPDVPATPYAAVLEDAVLPNVDTIAQAMRELARV